VLELQSRLIDKGDFVFLLTSRLTQDCLENLFSCVRGKNPIPFALEMKKSENIDCVTVGLVLFSLFRAGFQLFGPYRPSS